MELKRVNWTLWQLTLSNQGLAGQIDRHISLIDQLQRCSTRFSKPEPTRIAYESALHYAINPTEMAVLYFVTKSIPKHL